MEITDNLIDGWTVEVGDQIVVDDNFVQVLSVDLPGADDEDRIPVRVTSHTFGDNDTLWIEPFSVYHTWSY
jgi:uncharacterized Zn finger protein